MTLTRRRLLAASAAGLAAPGAFSRRSCAASIDSRLRVGVIGCGVRGRYLIGNLPAEAKIVAVCDCATSRMTETLRPDQEWTEVLGGFAAVDGPGCRTFQDFRRMIDAGGLDAVVIAAPDHHHVPAALHALEAGLHVYLEKPASLTIAGGRAVVDAARRSGRVVQVGSQQRSMEADRIACAFVRDGGLGRVSRVEIPNYPGPQRDPDWPAEPIPPGLDWELFLGDTPRRPHNKHLWAKDRFKVDGVAWRGWDLYRAYSGHLTTNWGAHTVDMVQWALGMDASGPVRIDPVTVDAEVAAALEADWQKRWFKKTPHPTEPWSQAGRFRPLTMTYANGVRLEWRPGIGPAVFHGERGRLEIVRNGYRADPPSLLPPPDAAAVAAWEGKGFVARPHLQNWLEAIDGRAEPVAPAEVGHRTATVCHLANLCRELGRPLKWDPTAERFVDDQAADALLSRANLLSRAKA